MLCKVFLTFDSVDKMLTSDPSTAVFSFGPVFIAQYTEAPPILESVFEGHIQILLFIDLVRLTLAGIPRRSPFGNVNNLLSSKTLFKFSTHSGSTSPSKMIHWRLWISPRTLSMILGSKNERRRYKTLVFNFTTTK